MPSAHEREAHEGLRRGSCLRHLPRLGASDVPSDKACIGCHGTMDKIPTKPNAFDKFPHASAHYGNTLECTTCHVVEWTNFR